MLELNIHTLTGPIASLTVSRFATLASILLAHQSEVSCEGPPSPLKTTYQTAMDASVAVIRLELGIKVACYARASIVRQGSGTVAVLMLLQQRSRGAANFHIMAIMGSWSGYW